MTRTIAILVAILLLLLAGVLNAEPEPAPTIPVADTQALEQEALQLEAMRLDHEKEMAKIRSMQPDSVEAEAIIGVSIPIVMAIVVFLFLWRSMEARKTVRLAMIEKGMDPAALDSGNESTKKYGALRIGMLLTGTGLGLLVGMGVSTGLALREEETVFTILSCALLFGGAGLIVYHRTVARLENQRGNER